MNQKIEGHIQKLYEYLEAENLEGALDYLETLSSQERTYWEIENITGVICSYCGQFQEAVSFYRRALKANPDSPDIYYNLADAYFCLEEYQQAELMLNSCEYITEDVSLLEGIQQMRTQISAKYEENPQMKEENSVLMVAYYFPPLSGSGVFRSLKFAKYLSELGWKPTVISAEEPPKGWNFRDDSMVSEIPETVNVIRIADKVSTKKELEVSGELVNPVMKFLKNILQSDNEAMDIFVSLLSSKQGIMKLLTFPCACLLWVWDTVKYIEEHMDINKFQVIYTTSGPASSHLVGFYMKKKYGIPWVADYRDPWTFNPYGYINIADPMHKLLYRLEHVLLSQADCNITVEESLVMDYINKFGIQNSQMASITNGYDEADFSSLCYKNTKTEKFTISYSGLLYTQQRSIVPVLDALRQLKEERQIDLSRVKLHLVGNGNEEINEKTAEEYGLLEILEQTGYVTHQEALQSNLDSDLLLLLIGDEERFKPVYTRKVFDYLRSGKPILALGPKEGAVDKLLTATGHGKTFLSTQISEIKNMILEEYEKWLNAEYNTYFIAPAIKVHERKYLTMKLVDVFLKLKKI